MKRLLHDKATPNLLPKVAKELDKGQHNLLQMFFEAGAIPNLATNPSQYEALTGLFERNWEQIKH